MDNPGDSESLDALKAVLRPAAKCKALVAAFYDDGGPFSGQTFLSLTPNDPNKIQAADLLAVTTMDERYGPLAVRKLLSGSEGRQVSRLLVQISADCDLWAAGNLSSASSLWYALTELPGVGPTRASKLMTRKRPRLIPVYDSVVGRHIAKTTRYWQVFQQFLSTPNNRRALDKMRPGGLSAQQLPTLRILDTVIWMRHSESKNAKSARRSVGL